MNKYKPFGLKQGAMHCQWKDKVLAVTPSDFDRLALDLFHFQYQNNLIYRQYADVLNIDRENGKQHRENTLPADQFFQIA
jgi:hypothetical protein